MGNSTCNLELDFLKKMSEGSPWRGAGRRGQRGAGAAVGRLIGPVILLKSDTAFDAGGGGGGSRYEYLC